MAEKKSKKVIEKLDKPEVVTPAQVAEAVEHPDHYGGGDNPYEVIKVLEAWGFNDNARLWNAIKYIARRGKKASDGSVSIVIEDLKKARFYLDREIKNLESGK